MELDRQQEIADLLTKFLKGEILSEIEESKIDTWISESETNAELWNRLSDADYVQKNIDIFWAEDNDHAWQKLLHHISEEEQEPRYEPKKVFKIRYRRFNKYAAAVVSFLLIGGVMWLVFGNSFSFKKRAEHHVSQPSLDAANTKSFVLNSERKEGAKLVLGDGRTVYLESQSADAFTEKDGTRLENKANELVYASSETGDQPVFNTLIIPRGSVYQLRLSDGTEISLNSGSTLRYPTQFKGKTRQVFLTGEAYFDVAHDAHHPFIVTADKMDVTVLGTRFNVSSYPEDAQQKTTLFQGAVKISEAVAGKKKEVLLKPGYEAVLQKNEGEIVVNKIKESGKPGWKENMFVFENETLGNIMKKLSREYNIKVMHMEGVDSSFHFTGRIKMGDNLKDLIDLIELTGKVKFIIKNDELWVTPAGDVGE